MKNLLAHKGLKEINNRNMLILNFLTRFIDEEMLNGLIKGSKG